MKSLSPIIVVVAEIGYILHPSRNMTEIALKRHKMLIQPKTRVGPFMGHRGLQSITKCVLDSIQFYLTTSLRQNLANYMLSTMADDTLVCNISHFCLLLSPVSRKRATLKLIRLSVRQKLTCLISSKVLIGIHDLCDKPFQLAPCSDLDRWSILLNKSLESLTI